MRRHDTDLHEILTPESGVEALSIAGLDGKNSGVTAADPRHVLGQELAAKRESMGLSVDDIARTTKIPVASLHHLEAGRFDDLPGDVFVRGFLRSYARCIHLDGDEIVCRYARCGLSPAPVSSELAETLLARDRRIRSRGHAEGTQPPEAVLADMPGSADESASEEASSAGEASEAPRRPVTSAFRGAFEGVQRRAEARREAARLKGRKSAEASGSEEQSSPAKSSSAQNDSEAANPSPKVGKRNRAFVPPRFDFEEDMSHRGPLTLGVIILVIVATLTMSYLLRRPGTSTDGFTQAPLEAPAELA